MTRYLADILGRVNLVLQPHTVGNGGIVRPLLTAEYSLEVQKDPA